MPASSATLKLIELEPDSVWLAALSDVPLTLEVTSVQEPPLSRVMYRMSSLSRAPDRVQVMVCDAVLVLKSESLRRALEPAFG